MSPGRLPCGVALAALAAFAASACTATTEAVDSCRAPLGGVWRATSEAPVPAAPLHVEEQLAFDVRDEGGSIALYPLWDSSRPPGGKSLSSDEARSPWRITLTRAGDAAVGQVSWRITQGGHTCAVKQPARLSACRNREAMLELTLASTVDPASCAVTTPPARVRFALTRQ